MQSQQLAQFAHHDTKKAHFMFIFIEIQETVIQCRSKEKSLHIVHKIYAENFV